MEQTEIFRLLADRRCQEIIQLTKNSGKTVEEISEELGIPLSSTYRKIKELKEAKLIFVENRILTPSGKLCDLFRCCVRGLKVELGEGPPVLNMSLIDRPQNRIIQV